MDYVNIMEQILHLNESREGNMASVKNSAISISIKAAKLLELIQSKSNEETVNLVDKAEIKEKVADFILPLLYLFHNLDISGNEVEAIIYSKILKEYNNAQPVNNLSTLKRPNNQNKN